MEPRTIQGNGTGKKNGACLKILKNYGPTFSLLSIQMTVAKLKRYRFKAAGNFFNEYNRAT